MSPRPSFLLALLAPLAALAVPDVCDDGGGAMSGGIGLMPSADLHIVPTRTGDHAGRAMVVADFDGDGQDDLAVSAEGGDTTALNAGEVWIWFGPLPVGGAVPGTDADVVVRGESVGDQSGWSLSAGDVDGDGTDDLLVGSLAVAGGSFGSGIAHLVYGARLSVDTEIDLATEADARFLGLSYGDELGSAVSIPGDLDADGFADIVLGAPKVAAGGFKRGEAYVYYGPVAGEHVVSDADARLRSLSDTSSFGIALSGVGDVNGDGRDDVGVGAPRDDTSGSRAGAFYVFAGGSARMSGVLTPNDAQLRLYGVTYDRAGSSASPAGDVDGDGFDDFWVGSKQLGGLKIGAAFLVRGSAVPGPFPLAGHATFAAYGPHANALAGTTIQGDVDIDGDGTADVIIGGERGWGAVVGSGAAWVLHGPFTQGGGLGLELADATLQGTAYLDYAGSALAAGDLDGDGFDDVVVGAWRSSDTLYRSGDVAIVRGGRDDADLTTWYADIDSDGFGAPGTSQDACEQPDGFVDVAGDCDDGDPTFRPSAPESCAGPDKNCDGHVGLVDDDGDGFAACEGDCDDGDDTINPTADDLCGDGIDNDCNGEVDGATAADATAWYVDGDGDGYGNRIASISACSRPSGGLNFIATGGDCRDGDPTIHPGAPELCDGRDNDCDNQFDEADALDALTWYADIDADGFGDPYETTRACVQPSVLTGSGWVDYVVDHTDCDDDDANIHPNATETCDLVDNDCDGAFYLGGRLDVVDRATLSLAGNSTTQRLGTGGVHVVADLDLDGLDDLIVALPGASDASTSGGVVLMRRGRSGGGPITVDRNLGDGNGGWDTKFLGTRRGGNLGSAVAAADFNGDGVTDLALGAGGARVPNIDQGAVYVFFGPIPSGTLQLDDASVLLRGEAAGTRAGDALATGDVNGDGYADLLIGAPNHAPGAGARGKAYLWYGGPTSDARIQLSDLPAVVGVADADHAGSEVALADLDGDDLDDLVVAAGYAEALDRGALYLVWGSATPLSGLLPTDVTLSGRSNGEHFANSLAALGDVDGDGIDDLLVGSQGNAAYLLRGASARWTSGGVATQTQVRFIAAGGAQAGRDVAAPGDINGDGLADMLIGAVDDDDVARDAGAAYVVYGRARFEDVVATGANYNLVNLAAFAELAPGTTFPTLSATNLGRLEGAKLLGKRAGDNFGAALAGGDMDGDGFADVVLASSGYDTPAHADAGLVTVLPGGRYGTDLGVTDGTAETWWWDRDDDGYTDVDGSFEACDMHVPTDLSGGRLLATPTPSAQGDCDDGSDAVRPCGPEWAADGVDSDCDGLDNPVLDADGDGLSMADELWIYGTCPDLADTDGDGVDDGDEVFRGSDPADATDLILGIDTLVNDQLRVVEVMARPAACGSADGEYVEILVRGSSRVDLTGLDLDLLSGAEPLAGVGVVAPGDRIVLAHDSAAFAACYGFPPDGTFSQPMADTGDRVELQVAGRVVAALDFRSWAVPAGIAWQRDAVNANSWCIAPAASSSGDLGSPGDVNATCSGSGLADLSDLAPGDLTITEVMVDPAACTDGNGEYIELFYAGTDIMDLTGLKVADGASSATLANVSVLPDTRIVLARSAAGYEACYGRSPTSVFGFDLANTGEVISILDTDAFVIDTVDTRAWRAAAGYAFERGDGSPLWCMADATAPSGDRGSPGQANGGCTAGDFDGDGVVDAEETCLNLDPFHPDSDRDGTVDGVELDAATNPHGTSTNRGWRLQATVVGITDGDGLLTDVVGSGDDLTTMLTFNAAVADGDVAATVGQYTWSVPSALSADVTVGALHGTTVGASGSTSLRVTVPNAVALTTALPLKDADGAFTSLSWGLALSSAGSPLTSDALFAAPPDVNAPGTSTVITLTVTRGASTATVQATVTAWSLDNDGDGLVDSDERSLGLDPWKADTDSDGVRDDDEVRLGLLGCTADTDGDGYNDGIEVRAWSDPTNPASGPLTIASLTPGSLRVTEFMNDSWTCSDADGEYTEVLYTGPVPVLLDGLLFRNQLNVTGTVSGGLVAQPGERVVLSRGAGFTNCYGFAADAVISVGLADGGDRIRLLAGATVLVDLDFRSGFGVARGIAMELDDIDTARWCRSEDATPRGDLGTPGAPNGFCPSADDPDRDGVVSSFETCMGLDPNRPDSDSDSVGDGYELAAGTNPHGNERVRGWRIDATTTGSSVTPPATNPGLASWTFSVLFDTLTPDGNVSATVGDYTFSAAQIGLRALVGGVELADVDGATATGHLTVVDGGAADSLSLAFEDDLDPASGFSHVRIGLSLSGTGSGNDPLRSDDIPVGTLDMAGFDNTASSFIELTLAGGGSIRLNGAVTAVVADDDGDGQSTADETAAGTDPWSADSDADGLSDRVETSLGLGLCTHDTDGDGFDDGIEVTFGSDPLLPASRPRTANQLLAGELRITEVMVDPTACTDPNGEYVELAFEGTQRFLLRGLLVSDNGSTRTVTSETIVEPGDRIVLARSAGFTACYGFDADAITLMDLTNSGDLVRVAGDAGAIDELDFRAGTGLAIPAGAALIVDDAISDRWCAADSASTSGDQGSPGTANGTCPDPNDLDGDGLTNGAEVCLGTDPLVADGDGDGVDDGAEVAAGTNPHGSDNRRHWRADATVDVVFDPSDLLAGMVSSGAPLAYGWAFAPNLVDQDVATTLGAFASSTTDLDGDLSVAGIDMTRGPGSATWTTDTASGTWDLDIPLDGAIGAWDTVQVTTHLAATTGPGPLTSDALPSVPPALAAFDDAATVVVVFTRGAQTAMVTATIDAWRADADADGVDDATELAQGSDPWNADTDGDGLHDANERSIGTAVCTADTDGDGFSDGVEVRAGTNPQAGDDAPLAANALTVDDILITEFLATGGGACADADAEYVEVLYSGARPAYLLGADLVDAGNTRRALGDTVALPGQRLILARSLGFTSCYGFAPDGVTSLVLDNADRIRFEAGGRILDEVDYRNGPAFVVTPGVAKERDDSALWLWCDAEDALATGMSGTPGTSNGACPPDPDGDGLVFEVEACLGTNAYDADSDGDGVTDDAEVLAGTNPHSTEDIVGWRYIGAVSGVSGDVGILRGAIQNGDPVSASYLFDATEPDANPLPDVSSFNLEAPDGVWAQVDVGTMTTVTSNAPFLGSAFIGVDRTQAQPKLFWSTEMVALGTSNQLTVNAGHEIQASSAPSGYGATGMPHAPLSLTSAASVVVSLRFTEGASQAEVGLSLYSLVRDDDLDGRTNAAELVAGTDPWRVDSDGDGLDDDAEAAASSNPCAIDTDGDGASDAAEVAAGTDPNNPASVP